MKIGKKRGNRYGLIGLLFLGSLFWTGCQTEERAESPGTDDETNDRLILEYMGFDTTDLHVFQDKYYVVEGD
ncbi:MAG: hypothetical protein LUD68_05930, partial [Rikenellaceae bacterium]|nr:hypothetical protein [Rikenellaceae bacterium]